MMAAPEVARQQAKAAMYQQLGQLPQTVMDTYQKMKKMKQEETTTAIENQLKQAQIKETEAKATSLLQGKQFRPKTLLRGIGGQIAAVKIGPDGGVISIDRIGISPKVASKYQEANQTFNTADNLLKTIKDLSSKVITAEVPGQIPGQYIKTTIGNLTRSNPNAVAFTNALNAFSSLLTRAAGEKGVLTDLDVQRILTALPKANDTIASSTVKLATLESLFESSKEGALSSILNTPGVEGFKEVGSPPSLKQNGQIPEIKKYTSPNMVKAAIKANRISLEQGQKILKDQFGFTD